MDRMIRPLHAWVWRDPVRRGQKLLRFSEVEADGGRDLARAAELTPDARLRELYLRHASDELRHAELFRQRGVALLTAVPNLARGGFRADWLTPGERGLDDVRVEKDGDAQLLAFLHLSEKAAAERFAIYEDVLCDDETRAVFTTVLRDEAFHMNYTHAQLKRIAPRRHGRALWLARLSRLWKGYLRIATAVAGVLGGVMLTIQYFLLLPPFALLARRAARREVPGWTRVPAPKALKSPY
jgi:rubrerythrin